MNFVHHQPPPSASLTGDTLLVSFSLSQHHKLISFAKLNISTQHLLYSLYKSLLLLPGPLENMKCRLIVVVRLLLIC